MTKAKKKQPPVPISLTVLTGFLGSGKTTLLNWVLGHEQFSNSVVIINEFGDVGLDHMFVERSDEQMIEMSSGCLCCTIRGDLCDTLEKLLRDRDNDRIKKFDRIIIETTGLADPAPIVQTLISHPYFLIRFHMNALITTVDAQHFLSILEAHEEALKQAAMADVLVLTKTDLADISEPQIEAVRQKLTSLNRTAQQVRPGEDALLDAFLTPSTYMPNKDNPDILRWLHGAAHEEDGHHHHGAHDHAHLNVNIHNTRVRSFSFTHEGAIDLEKYELFLELLRENFGAQLLRYKALVNIRSHEDTPLVSHGVQHVFYPSVFMESWPVADRLTRIVCITDGVEEAEIASLFKAFAGQINQAENPHLYQSDNPLALKRGDGLFEGEEK